MNHARKMMIVPIDTTNKTINNPSSTKTASVQTVGDNLSRLDAELSEVLNSKDIKDEAEKSKIYLQILMRYLHFKDRERFEKLVQEKKESNEKQNEKLSTNIILDEIPKTYRRNALQLLNIFHNNNAIEWDGTGVVSINEKKIENSNITDLVNGVLRKTKKNFKTPVGWSEFLNFVKGSDIPSNLINNPEISLSSQKPASSSVRKRKRKEKDEETYKTPTETPKTHSGAVSATKWLKFT